MLWANLGLGANVFTAMAQASTATALRPDCCQTAADEPAEGCADGAGPSKPPVQQDSKKLDETQSWFESRLPFSQQPLHILQGGRQVYKPHRFDGAQLRCFSGDSFFIVC